jgi:hypothetical protein
MVGIIDFWEDLVSGDEYNRSGLDEPSTEDIDNFFLDYALPVGLNTVMNPFQTAKDMLWDAPKKLITEGDIWGAVEEYDQALLDPFMETDRFRFPFNPDLDPDVNLSALTDDLAINYINSGNWGGLGSLLLQAGAGTTKLSDILNFGTNIPSYLASPLGIYKAATKVPAAGAMMKKLYPYTMGIGEALAGKGSIGRGKGFWPTVGRTLKHMVFPGKGTATNMAINTAVLGGAHHLLEGRGYVPKKDKSTPVQADFAFEPSLVSSAQAEEVLTPKGPGPWNEFKG